jgi:hypothetical protein
MEEGMGYLGKIVLASPLILGTPSLPTDDEISPLGSSSLPAREWTHSATKFLIELVRERIESFGTTVFKQQNWEKIREQILKEHPNEARRTWTQIRDKWDKLKRHYHKEKKLHNVTGDNAWSQWIWFNTIDEVLSGTAKADGVPGGMDNGEHVGVEEQIPSQEEEATQEGREEEPDSPRTRASNLPGVRGQHVKRRRLASDMAASLDRFCESTRRIEELKLEAAVEMQKENRQLELEMFKLTQASQERMAGLFVNVLQNLKK